MTSPALFLAGFMFIFVLGGLTGVMVAVLPFDWQAHDTYFIVAHLHYVLVGGMVFPVFAALYYWLPLVKGRQLSERLGKWVFWLMFAGFNIAFFPMHVTGLLGMPRRVYTYPAEMGWDGLNLASTVGAFVLAGGVLLFVLDVARTLRRPTQPVGNPWNASTLEWLPTETYGTRSIPEVHSSDPLWDQPGLREEVEAGRHYLPGTASGGRETIATSPIAGTPRYLLILPGDGWLPFVAAAGTAGFFLLLTVKMTLIAWACGIAAVGATLAWLWGADRVQPIRQAQVSDTLTLPVGARGTASHSWWATIIMLVVDATIFASFVFAYIHISMRLEVCPPPSAALPERLWPLLSGGLLVASSGLVLLAGRGIGRRWLPWLVLAATACMAASYLVELHGYGLAGLAPRTQAWSATIAAILAYQGFHVIVLALAGAYLAARAWSGRLTAVSRATFDNTALMWHYTTLQGIAGALAVHLVPLLME
jgi:cytochrome c oxidase subunit I+III